MGLHYFSLDPLRTPGIGVHGASLNKPQAIYRSNVNDNII